MRTSEVCPPNWVVPQPSASTRAPANDLVANLQLDGIKYGVDAFTSKHSIRT